MSGFVSDLCNLRAFGIVGSRVISAFRLIEHRGPDGEAFYFSPECFAVFRRLNIFDLSNVGSQSMVDALTHSIQNEKQLKGRSSLQSFVRGNTPRKSPRLMLSKIFLLQRLPKAFVV
jgi:hypothetical protein